MKIATLGLLILFGLTLPSSPAPAQRQADSRAEGAVRSFLARKADQQQARQKALTDLRASGNDQHAYDCLTQARVPPTTGNNTYGETYRTLLDKSLRVDVAQLMASTQYVLPQQCDSRQFQAISLAALRYIKGGAGLSDYATLADTIGIAIALDPGQTSSRIDGYGSSQRLQLVEVFAGNYREGQRLQLRQASGRGSDGLMHSYSNESRLEVGKRYLVLLSRQQYLISLKEKGATLLADDRTAPAMLATVGPEPLFASDVSPRWGERGRYSRVFAEALRAKK